MDNKTIEAKIEEITKEETELEKAWKKLEEDYKKAKQSMINRAYYLNGQKDILESMKTDKKDK